MRTRVALIVSVALLLFATAAGNPRSIEQTLNSIVELELPSVELDLSAAPAQSYVYAADGTELAVLRRQFSEHISYDELPEHLIHAVIEAEDQRFFEHGGIDARAITRALLTNAARGEVEQGGSTISQQVIKNLQMPDAPRTPETKVKEALLARKLETKLSKEEILEEYLNTVYFGSGAYGIEAAAQTYWSISARNLSLAQSALLAGIIRSPSNLTPHDNPDGARERRAQVLNAMAEAGYITEENATRASKSLLLLTPAPPPPERLEPRWVDMVVRDLLSDPTFGDNDIDRANRLYNGGLRVHTTLDRDLQAKAVAAVERVLPARDGAPEAAIATVDVATGELRALVGGRDYGALQFDLGSQGRRQPGSTFKTFVLAAAVSSGMGPRTIVDGNQGTVNTANGPWEVHNFARVSYGKITLSEATRASVNGAFARLILDVGVGRVVATAHAMGIDSRINEDAPIALGGLTTGVTPLEMAGAYATLANLGERIPVHAVSRIEDAAGNVIWRPDNFPVRVLDPSAAFVTTKMLQDVVDDGSGKRASVPGWEVAGKTGTVQDFTDAWFVGYTPALSTAVWIGHPSARVPLRGIEGWRTVTGGSLPAQIFATYMTDALESYRPSPFLLPVEHYRAVTIDPITGLLAAEWCPGEEELMPRVIVPRETCPMPPPPPTDIPTEAPFGTPEPTAAPDTPTPEPSDQPDATPTPAPSPSANPSPSPQPSQNPSPSPAPPPFPGTSPSPNPSTDPGGSGGTG